MFLKELNQLNKNNRVGVKSQLKALNLFIDDKGLIRVGGRLKTSSLTYAERHPIVPPAKNHVTRLIIRDIRIENFHSRT
jgi:hypothetical protein